MALEVATGQFAIGTGAATTTVTVSGLAFQPKVVLFTWIGRTANGQAEGDHKMGVGYMISATDRGCSSTQSLDAAGTSAADHTVYEDEAIVLISTAGAVDGSADFDAFLSDGFRLIIDDAFSLSYTINYLAIGGSDLTDVVSTTVTEPATTGTQDINVGVALNTGLDDKCVIFMGTAFAPGSIQTSSKFSLGVAAGDTIVNAVMAGFAEDAAGVSETQSYCRMSDSLSRLNANIVQDRASVTAWLSNGFRLTWDEVDTGASSATWRALVLKGGRYEVGSALTSTGTTNQTEGTAYVPKAIMVASSNKAESAADTSDQHDERSVGFATGPAARNYISMIDKDAVGTTDIGVAIGADEMYANQSTAAAIAIEGLMDLVSFDSTPGFTYVMDDADPVASFFWYLSMADVPAAGGGDFAGNLALLGVGGGA